MYLDRGSDDITIKILHFLKAQFTKKYKAQHSKIHHQISVIKYEEEGIFLLNKYFPMEKLEDAPLVGASQNISVHIAVQISHCKSPLAPTTVNLEK